MPDVWLIDGYNLLHSLGSPGKKGRGLTRESLAAKLAGFAETEGCELILVLDGQGPQDELLSHRTRYFNVVYSSKVSADTFIEKALYDRKNERLHVVTQDTAIRRMARGCGAAVYDSGEFMERLNARSVENDDKLFKEKVRAHGFNRPFDGKLKGLDGR